nr:host-nuclease inhibitor Gam family protein [uncultured Treponema sp.]
MKQLRNVSQIEDALHRVAELDIGISEIENKASEIINNATAEAEAASREMLTERAELIEQIKCYSDNHREELYLNGKKSAALTNGTIGYRKGADKIEVSDDTAELLEKAGFAHCIKIKKEPVKAALKGFSDDDLCKFGATRIKGSESFYVEASEACIKSLSKGAA